MIVTVSIFWARLSLILFQLEHSATVAYTPKPDHNVLLCKANHCKMKRQPTEGENIFANHISDKELMCDKSLLVLRNSLN